MQRTSRKLFNTWGSFSDYHEAARNPETQDLVNFDIVIEQSNHKRSFNAQELFASLGKSNEISKLSDHILVQEENEPQTFDSIEIFMRQ